LVPDNQITFKAVRQQKQSIFQKGAKVARQFEGSKFIFHIFLRYQIQNLPPNFNIGGCQVKIPLKTSVTSPFPLVEFGAENHNFRHGGTE
jgi:hypothetical protein